MYARAYLEGRLNEQQLQNFRQELAEGGGLSSYPHPYLMPEFWQFPTVSMGLGPIMSLYQARFNRYLQARGPGEMEGGAEGLGVFSATANRTNPNRSARSRSPPARTSTTSSGW